MIRESKQSDYNEIKALLEICFGIREENAYLANLENRYILKIVDDRIVALTGLIWDDEYKALEIDWTCTHPDYRHQGHMQELFNYMLDGVTKKVYCSCWRLPGKEINLKTLMKMFNFKEVINTRVTWCVGHNCHRDETLGNRCVYYKGKNCICCEDLYLRELE